MPPARRRAGASAAGRGAEPAARGAEPAARGAEPAARGAESPPPPARRELSLDDVFAAAPGAVELVVRSLDGDGRKALRLTSPLFCAAVDGATIDLLVDRRGPPPLARAAPSASRFPRLARLAYEYGDAPVAAADITALARGGACAHLTEVRIGGGELGRRAAGALGRAAAAALPALRALELQRGLDLDHAAAEALFRSEWPPSLAAVAFDRTAATQPRAPRAAAALAAAWRRAPGLRALDATGHSMGAADARELARAGWPLEALCVSRNPIFDAGFAALVAAPAFRLRELSALKCGLRGASLHTLLEDRAGFRLEKLDLSWNALRDGGPVLAALAARHPLRELSLAGCDLGTAALEAVVSGEWAALERLRLDHNDGLLADFGEAAFARMPALRHLSLSRCRVGAAGARLLARRAWRRLAELELHKSELGDAGVAELARGEWPALALLDLRDNGLGAPPLLEDAGHWAPALQELRQ
jgi:hypothetical protein